MAVTYRARMNGAAGVTKPVVIKQILPHFADDPGFVEMFVSEARVAAGLTHGNIAQVFDFGEIDGQFFLAMEFVHGQPLSKVLRRAQRTGLPSLPLPLALHVAIQMCDGLDYAHRHVSEDGQPMGLVHRDVSPDNVLISYEGQVKVIDFGIAKATSVVESRTSPGTLKGKYPYFSTEQARGQQDLDARSDIFAVGVVLYEMVCGRRPYEGELVAVLPRILSGDYAAPSALNPAITPELESVMATAMALDRDTRYPTAQAFSEALREQLYSANARFSPAMLSQLMGHLFSEELAAEGRRVEVPPSFLEQLSVWQAQAQPTGEPTGVLPRQSGTGGGRTSTGSGVRAVRPGSDSGRPASGPGIRSGASGAQKPPSNGTGGRPSSNASGRAVSSASVRRVTSSAVPRTPASPTLAEPPDLAAEPSTAVSQQATAATDSVEEPRDTPVDMPAVTVPAARLDPLGSFRQAQERDAQERADRRQRLVMLISLPLIGLALFLGAINYFLSGRGDGSPTGSLWLTSTPSGASVKLNGKDVPGVTPLVVGSVPLEEANTLVLTLPGYRPWTKRFTRSSDADPPIHAELERLQEEPAPPEKPQPTEAVAATTAEPVDAGTEAPKSNPYNEVDYPARLIVLRPKYNAFPVTQYTTASIDLSPSASYSVNTEGSASLAEERGGASGTLAYFLEGDNVSVDESFGLIGPASRTIKGARRLHVFLLDDDVSDNSGTVRVHLRQSKWTAPRQLTFNAAQDALALKPEHQLVLRGLNPDALYLLTVRDDLPELRSGAGGRTRRVLCAESNQKSARRTHRLFESGKRYQLTGADTLRCTYPDTRLEDNAGALEVDIVDVTDMSRRDRAAALRGASR
ncbi:protein kinase [Archangium violaceum]|nr:serine/threonine-protein kinase [Archangium violaceum]QRO03015.1 protein kinase [Archangium violaceum]